MRELFLPQFMDRRPFNEWEAKKDDARDWALAKARKTLETHQPDPLDEKISTEMAKDHFIAGEKMTALQPKLELLTYDLIARILDEAFQLMQKPGIKVQSSEARDLLIKAGATADGRSGQDPGENCSQGTGYCPGGIPSI